MCVCVGEGGGLGGGGGEVWSILNTFEYFFLVMHQKDWSLCLSQILRIPVDLYVENYQKGMVRKTIWKLSPLNTLLSIMFSTILFWFRHALDYYC